MIQEIKYNGITTNPSDYESPDGDLAICNGLLNEDGALMPLPQPSQVMTLTDGLNVVFIHRTTAIKHYIIANADNSALFWQNDNSDTTNPLWQAPTGIVALNLAAIGNTLVLTATDGIHYFLWKNRAGETPSYLYLGTKPPFLNIQFGTGPNSQIEGSTSAGIWESRQTGVNWNPTPPPTQNRIAFSSSNVQPITEAAWAVINETNAQITQANHFYAPFFVRYCYRLYDGSTFMHSAPVLIPLSMPYQFRASIGWDSGGDVYVRYDYNNIALKYKIISSELSELRDWGDIVKGVDIYSSLPFTREDNSKEIKEARLDIDDPVLYHDNTCEVVTTAARKLDIPFRLTESSYLDYIKSVASFFKIASYDIEDTSTTTGLRTGTDNDHPDGFYEVNIPTGILSSLATQEAMTDDYKTHNSLIPADGCTPSSFIYNRRLNLAGFAEKLFDGFCVNTLLPYVTPSNNYNVRHICVYLNTEEGEKMVIHQHPDPDTNPALFSLLLLYNNPLFYPDNRATRMEVVWQEAPGTFNRSIFPMKPCPLLNGAYTTGGIITSLAVNNNWVSSSPTPPTPNNIVNVAHKIYTSEVNNPLFFPVTGINTVGSGIVLGLAAATKALSEGQFGEFPLYAFTTEGIWGLTVNSTGGYSSAKPVSRDVCINPRSITPIDNAVLFASSRGIMLLQGSNTVCISDRIKDNPNPSIPSILSSFSTPSLIPFSDFLTHCRMAYDYTHQRVHLFNPDCNYAYIFSLKSHLWTMTDSNLTSVVNDYPDTLAMTNDGTLVSLTQPQLNSQFSTLNSQLFVTRPIKLGDPNTLKTALTVIQRGMFQHGDIKTMLYGSRDLFHWHLIARSSSHELRYLHGSPYKYFRIATVATLTPDKSLFGATIEYKTRHTTTLQ